MTATPTCIRSSAVVQVSDVVASRDYYVEKLGFSAAGLWGDPPAFCIVGRGTVTLFLDQSRQDTLPVNQFWAAYIYVDDVDTLHDEFQDRGVEIPRGPEDQPYGCRDFDIRDPDGHLIAFGQDLQPSAAGPGLGSS